MQPSKKALLIGFIAALGFGMVSVFIFPLYFTLPGVLLLPFFVCLYFYFGPFSAGLAITLLAFIGYVAGGLLGGLLPIMAYVPALICASSLLRRRAPVHFILYALCATMLASLALYMALANAFLPDGLVGTLAASIIAIFDEYMALTPNSLWTMSLANMGLTADLLDTAFRAALPSQMMFHSTLSALLGMCIPIALLRRGGHADLVSGLAPFHTWRVPRNIGTVVGLSYVVCSLIAMFGSGLFAVIAEAAWQPMLIMYTAVALGRLSSMMRMKGYGRSARNILIAICSIVAWLLQSVPLLALLPVLLGILSESRRSKEPIPDPFDNPFGPVLPLQKPDPDAPNQ